MPITALDHIQLAMPPASEAKARAFYDGALPQRPHRIDAGGLAAQAAP
jgi:hypothetical protein